MRMVAQLPISTTFEKMCSNMFHAAVLLLAAISLTVAVDDCPESMCKERNCPPKNHTALVDLVFMVDGSESISDEDFNTALDFVLNTVDVFLTGRTDGLKVYLVQYSWNATLEINEAVASSSSEISDDVKNIVQIASGTRAYESLQYVNNEVLPLTRSGAYKILITLTDGKSNLDHLTADQRQEIVDTARRDFSLMVAVSVGAAINDEIRDFSNGIEPIAVENYNALRGQTVPQRVESTTHDCIELRSWCGPSTDGMLMVSYCVCPPHSDEIKSYHLTISPPDAERNSIVKMPGETTASFYGLTAESSYTINVTVETKRNDTKVYHSSSVCSTDGHPCGDINKCEPKPLQLVFLVDGSESITPEDFQNSLQWVLKTIDDLKPKDRSVTRVILFQYSELAEQELDRYVRESAEEIRAAVEGIRQIRRGTRPYTALRRVVSDISPAFYSVLITLSDGLSRKETRDTTAIDDAKRKFKTMVAVYIGTNEDANVLADFAGDNPVMESRDDQRIPGIIGDIMRKSHEDCIKFRVTCECIDDRTVEVSYTTSLRGPITNENQIISNYTVTSTIPPRSYSVPLGQTTYLLSNLEQGQIFPVTITGTRSNNSDLCAVIDPGTTTCRTGVFVQPEIHCIAGETDLTALVNVPGGLLLQRVDIELIQDGQLRKTKTFGDYSIRTTFDNLPPSTRYSIVARPIAHADTCSRIETASAECVTRDLCHLNLRCESSTNSTVTVSITVTTSNPGGIDAIIKNISITGPNDVTFNVDVDTTSYTFYGLNENTWYDISASTIPLASCIRTIVTCPTDGTPTPTPTCCNCDCILAIPILGTLLGLCIIVIIIFVIVLVRLKRKKKNDEI